MGTAAVAYQLINTRTRCSKPDATRIPAVGGEAFKAERERVGSAISRPSPVSLSLADRGRRAKHWIHNGNCTHRALQRWGKCAQIAR